MLLFQMMKSVPLFFRETNPQPRKHTLWHTSSDFTGGEAPKYRRHYIQFEEGTLQPHYDKLLQCDQRLFMLSHQPFLINRSLYFYQNMSGMQDFSFEFNRHQPDIAPVLQFSQYGIQGTTCVPFHQVQMFQQTPRPTYTDLCSPMSVIDFPPVEDHGGNHNVELRRTSIGGGTINTEKSYMEKGDQIQHFHCRWNDQAGHHDRPLLIQPLSFQYPLSCGDELLRPPSTNSLLKDIANQMLSVPITSMLVGLHCQAVPSSVIVNSYVVTIDGHKNVPVNDEDALMKVVANQPVSVAIDAGGSDFQFYYEVVKDGAQAIERC